MPSPEFEPAIPATKRLQTYSLDSAATGIGAYKISRFDHPNILDVINLIMLAERCSY
jgi:hypothetical protein